MNNLTRRIFHKVYDLPFPYRSIGVIDPERVRLKLMMFSGKLKRESRLIVENERLKFLTSLFRASSGVTISPLQDDVFVLIKIFLPSTCD